jgi:hypothetical protein
LASYNKQVKMTVICEMSPEQHGKEIKQDFYTFLLIYLSTVT